MSEQWKEKVEDRVETVENIDFSKEEEQIYEESITRIKEELDSGLGFDEACSKLVVDDEEFKRLIIDDYLKMTIADLHFNKEQSTQEVADMLKVPETRIANARTEMLDEVLQASVDAYHTESGEAEGPTGNA